MSRSTRTVVTTNPVGEKPPVANVGGIHVYRDHDPGRTLWSCDQRSVPTRGLAAVELDRTQEKVERALNERFYTRPGSYAFWHVDWGVSVRHQRYPRQSSERSLASRLSFCVAPGGCV